MWLGRTREAQDEAGVRQVVANYTGPGRLGKDFGFYLNCIRSALISRRLCCYLRRADYAILRATISSDGKLNMAAPRILFFFFGTCEWLISPRGKGLCLYSSLYFQGLAYLLAHGRYYIFIKRVSEWVWKWIPSNLFSSSLILFPAMFHLQFNLSLPF